LLFIPTNSQTPALKAVLSYYTSAVSLNAEGDTSIREETLEGLGRSPPKFLTVLFGAIVNIASSQRNPSLPSAPQSPAASEKLVVEETEEVTHRNMYEVKQTRFIDGALGTQFDNRFPFPSRPPAEQQEDPNEDTLFEQIAPTKKSLLTQILPDPGYFAAGGLAGVISRTATAPLDRLKVYLIANVGSANDPIAAVKRGDAATAARRAGRPLLLACKELWNAGGIRSLFAGMVFVVTSNSWLTVYIGNGLNVLKVMPESAIKFGSYEAAKRALAHLEGHGDPQNINPYSKFVAGGVGGLVSQ
jgi:solute carrier family 25 phosphate transporter 23/24/25/41